MPDIVVISRDELKDLLTDILNDIIPAVASGQSLNTPGMHPTISTKEAAAILNVSPFTVRKWAKEGRIPYSRVGKKFLLERDHIIKMAAVRKDWK